MVKRKRKPGGGRKKKYPTKTVRIPLEIEADVKGMKEAYEFTYALREGKLKTIHPMPSGLNCPIPNTDYGNPSERRKDRTKTGKEIV